MVKERPAVIPPKMKITIPTIISSRFNNLSRVFE
jgi:hypothetical protein